MIKRIAIKNFKSISEQTIELGRMNVIIGENGCGKTNILEAVVFAAAAANGQLNQERLGGRMRFVSPEFMTPAFEEYEEETQVSSMIEISVSEDVGVPKMVKAFYDTKEKEWVNMGTLVEDINMVRALSAAHEMNPKMFAELMQSAGVDESLWGAIDGLDMRKVYEQAPDLMRRFRDALVEKPALNSFVIYSPEEEKLRKFSDEAQLQPLGRNGEGLFQYLKELQRGEKRELFAKIVEGLSLLDWFDGTKIPEDLLSNEYRLLIGDKYLNEALHYFDQRSANEGFLFLLFYMTLFQSPDTPAFFAVDNIESSFNPKLCTRLVRTLIRMAKENNKQVLLTTHSPYVLDGLDLTDDEQRLFVARRNRYGHTQLRRIGAVKDRKMPLSAVWMNGMIGGLPDNF